MGVSRVGICIAGILALAFAEEPVANYMANFYDPHPVTTYGAHPFHSHEHSGSLEDHEEEEEYHPPHYEYSQEGSPERRGGSRRGSREYDDEDSYRSGRRYRGKGSQENKSGKRNKHPPQRHSHEERHEEIEDSPVYPYTSLANRPAPPSAYNSYQSSPEYSPYTAHIQPQTWYNTVGGGYDDYGYNYDRSSASSPKYKGPPNSSNKLYSSYSSPSSAEHDAPGTSHYSYATGGPQFESYADEHQDTKSRLPSSSGSSRRPSNGYGQDPYFTFGPKKSQNPSYSTPSTKPTQSSNSGYNNYKSKYNTLPKAKASPRPFPPSYYSEEDRDSNTKGKYSSSPTKSPPTLTLTPFPTRSSKQISTGSERSTAKAQPNLSEYYRTRSGGWSRSPQTKSLASYNYKYSTIPYHPNTSRARLDLENGKSEDYGKFNWEKEGWTITH